MRAPRAAVVAFLLSMLLLSGLLAVAGSASAQTTQPLSQLLTAEDLSETLEGLWTGACTPSVDSVTCSFGQTPTEGGGQVGLVMRVPASGSSPSSNTLVGWRTAILDAAKSAQHPTEPVADVGEEAYLVNADPVYRLEFFAGGMTGSLEADIPGVSPGVAMADLARIALTRLGVPAGTRSPEPAVSVAPDPSPGIVSVPTFTGLTIDDATARATQLGLRLTVRTDETSDQPPGTVIAQEPAPGVQVRTGDEIDLLVAAAPASAAPVTTPPPVAPVTTPPPVAPVTTVPTPGFIGLTLDRARDLAIAVGLGLRPVGVNGPIGTADVVRSQDPAVGVPIAPGSTVTVVMGPAQPVVTPAPTTPPTVGPVQAPGPGDISLDPVVIATTALAAAGIVLLIPFPSALFNSTLEENYDEIRGWFRFRRRRAKPDGDAAAPPEAEVPAETEPTNAEATTEVPDQRVAKAIGRLDRFWATSVGVASFFLIAGVLYGFLDPTFGLTLDSLLLLVGILAGLAIGTLAAAASLRWARERLNGERGRFRVLPATLIVAVACVLVTRITDFQPGYLYGVLAGLLFVTVVPERVTGREHAIASSVVAGVGVLAFLVLGIVRALEGSAGATGAWRPIDVALSALVIGGFEGLLFGMLPLTGLPGAKVKAWDTRVWALLLFLGAVLFLHVIVNPSSGYLVDSSRVPLLKAVALLVGFGAVSVGLWAWFRYRPMDRLRARTAAGPAPEVGAAAEVGTAPEVNAAAEVGAASEVGAAAEVSAATEVGAAAASDSPEDHDPSDD